MTAVAARTITPITDDTPRLRVLDETSSFITRFVVLNSHQLTAVTLWVAHSHAIDAANVTPYLAVTSAEMRSGKTRLLEVLDLIVCRSLRTGDFTEAALSRLIPHQPTLLLDEADTIFKTGRSREGLRALLNAGYRRGSPIRRVSGSDIESFDPFCAKVIAAIGNKLPDTVMDRSIPIRMTRRDATDTIERFREREASTEGHILRDQLYNAFGRNPDNADWLGRLAALRPSLPEWLNDRQQDSWEPLLALAEIVGGDWPTRALDASRELHKSGAELST